MTRISTFCVLSGALAALALSANGAGAGTLSVHTVTVKPTTHIGSASTGGGGKTVLLRKAGGSQEFTETDPELCCSGGH
jgi:hypothetical protein